jgi:hypothetical protein
MQADGSIRSPKRILLRLLRILAFATPVAALIAFLAYRPGIGSSPLDCTFTRFTEDCNWNWLNPLLWGPWPHRSAAYPEGLDLIVRALWWVFIGVLMGGFIEWELGRLKSRWRQSAKVD